MNTRTRLVRTVLLVALAAGTFVLQGCFCFDYHRHGGHHGHGGHRGCR